MGNCDSSEYKRETSYDQFSNGLKESFRMYTTTKGNEYMLWSTKDNGDIHAFLIRGIKNDIEYSTGPTFFLSDGGGAFERGDFCYYTTVIFRRTVSNKNILKPVNLKGYSHELVWIPFLPKSAKLARNQHILDEQQRQQENILKLVKGDKIKLREGDWLWEK